MRIIDEFDISGIKATVFKMNERISVKFEYNLLEQTYKFRDGSGVNTPEEVKSFCSEAFVQQLKSTFDLMASARKDSLLSMIVAQGEIFDEII